MVGTKKFPKKTITSTPLDGKTVLLRTDYNVPLGPEGAIMDDFRIRCSLPTIENLVKRQCRIVIVSHLGRPDGQIKPADSLEPIARHLAKLLSRPVRFISECVGDQVSQTVKAMHPGDVVLLENVRFHAGEETNDPTFAEHLAKSSRAEYFVQDGFGVVHRAHASTSAITQYLPSVSGLLLEKEWTSLTSVMHDPARPMVAILGGAKISDKIGFIERFVRVADTVVVGGAMANTFLKQAGIQIGRSVHEDGLGSIIESIRSTARDKGADPDDIIVLPTDVAVAKEIAKNQRRTVVSVDDVERDEMILDIGPDSISTVVEAIVGAKTVVWNGTLGYAELPQFSYGSARVALALASHPDIESVIGGGDTADFVLHWDSKNGKSFSHVSTGGGASLELMAGQVLPGIDVLLDA